MAIIIFELFYLKPRPTPTVTNLHKSPHCQVFPTIETVISNLPTRILGKNYKYLNNFKYICHCFNNQVILDAFSTYLGYFFKQILTIYTKFENFSWTFLRTDGPVVLVCLQHCARIETISYQKQTNHHSKNLTIFGVHLLEPLAV